MAQRAGPGTGAAAAVPAGCQGGDLCRGHPPRVRRRARDHPPVVQRGASTNLLAHETRATTGCPRPPGVQPYFCHPPFPVPPVPVPSVPELVPPPSPPSTRPAAPPPSPPPPSFSPFYPFPACAHVSMTSRRVRGVPLRCLTASPGACVGPVGIAALHLLLRRLRTGWCCLFGGRSTLHTPGTSPCHHGCATSRLWWQRWSRGLPRRGRPRCRWWRACSPASAWRSSFGWRTRRALSWAFTGVCARACGSECACVRGCM
jgi:hypothetical protein